MNFIVVGIIAGGVALLFAVGIVIWAIRLANQQGYSAATKNVQPVDKSTLKAMLLKLNQPGHPFQVHPSDEADLVIDWTVVDAKWIEIFGTGSERLEYHAWLALDESTRTVNYHERIYQASFSAGGGMGFTSESHAAKGWESMARRRGYRWGVREDFSIGEVFDYEFAPADIKGVVRQIANDHGWAFQLVLRKPRAVHAAAI